MNELFDNILTKDYFISIFAVMFTAVYAVTASYLLKRIKQRKEAKKSLFFETAIQGLVDGTIETTGDLINVYKGVTNLTTEDLTYRYGLNKWLREILAQLISRKICKELDIDQVKILKEKINDFIITNERTSPFSDLPDTERNLLSDVSSFSKSGDNESLDRKIIELSSVIQTRHEVQKKLESQNKWSIPIAVIGLILTVIFGIISIF